MPEHDDTVRAATVEDAPLRDALAVSDLAVLARTAVDCARLATLTTYTRGPRPHRTAGVALRPRPDGGIEVLLPPSAAAVAHLLARPLATVELPPAGHEPVVLHGSARRLRGASQDGRLAFHVDPGSLRVGRRPAPVDMPSYLRSSPDPLRHDAPAVIEHLNAGHREALAACLRARGSEVEIAQVQRLDAYGLTVDGIGPRGGERVRLPFGRRITNLAQLPPSLHTLLRPTCACPHATDGGAAGQAS